MKYTHPAIVERLRGIEDAQALYEKRGGKPAAIFETSKDKEDGVRSSDHDKLNMRYSYPLGISGEGGRAC